MLLLRGTADLLAAERPASSRAVQRSAGPAWPDDAARAFAVEFASVYLAHKPEDDPAVRARRLAAMAAPELAGELPPRYAARAAGQAVRSATVAGVVRIDGRRALVTVAATADEGRGDVRTRRLTVPVARDRAGGLAVFELPSFAPAPARAAVAAARREPLIDGERAAIGDVVTRYLRAYLAGDTGGLHYLVPPGARIAGAADRAELVEPVVIAAGGPPVGDARVVLASVRARDPRSRATYALRYRLRLVRRDRWYVAALNPPGKR
jgi:hypothetical protein